MAFLSEFKAAMNAATMQYNAAVERGDADAKADWAIRSSALSEIMSYIREGSWYPSKEFVAKVIHLTFSSKRKQAREELGITTNYSSTLMKRANDRLEEMIGSELIKRVLQGDVSAAMQEFRLKTGYMLSDDIFLREVQSKLPKGEPEPSFPLKECMTEVKFLTFYTKAVLNKRLEAVDKEKLAYLCHLITTYDERHNAEQKALLRVLQGEAPTSILEEFI